MGSSSNHEPHAHLYKIGEMVTFDPRGGHQRNPRGEFSVLAQLPPSDSDLQYRIKSANEPYQRVASEHQLMRPVRAEN